MMHADERQTARIGQSLRGVDANHQCSDQSGAVGDGDRFDVVEADFRFAKRALR